MCIFSMPVMSLKKTLWFSERLKKIFQHICISAKWCSSVFTDLFIISSFLAHAVITGGFSRSFTLYTMYFTVCTLNVCYPEFYLNMYFVI